MQNFNNVNNIKKINKMSKQKTLLKNFEKFQAVKGNIPICQKIYKIICLLIMKNKIHISKIKYKK